MAGYFALRDRRLSGGVPARAGLTIINTNGSTPLGNAFAQINAAARNSGKISALFILCHGYAGSNARAPAREAKRQVFYYRQQGSQGVD